MENRVTIDPVIAAAIGTNADPADLATTGFETHLNTLIYELRIKRQQTEGYESSIKTLQTERDNFQRMLATEQKTSEKLRLQMMLLTEYAQQQDKKLKELDGTTKYETHVEINTAEKEALKDQIYQQQKELMELKTKIQKLGTEHQVYEAFIKENMEQQNRVRAAISQINNSIEKAEENNEKLYNIDNIVNIFTSLSVAVLHYKSELTKATNAKKAMEFELICKTAELDTFKQTLRLSSPPVSSKCQEQPVEYNIQKLIDDLEAEKSVALQLSEAIKEANKVINKQAEEALLCRNKVKEMEEETAGFKNSGKTRNIEKTPLHKHLTVDEKPE